MPFIERPDARIYFEKSGNGPPVVFIQGAGVIGNGWAPQVRELSKSFTTLTFDNRGIGQSLPMRGKLSIEKMAGDVAALLDELSWTSAHIVGHSVGGLVAQQFALDHPSRVRSLSLLCTFGRGKDGGKVSTRMIWLFLRTRVGTARMRRHAFLSMLFSKKYLEATDKNQLAKDLIPLMGRDLAHQDPIAMKQVQAMARHDTSLRLPELKSIPVMIISADEDPIAKPEYGKVIAEALPQSSFEILPGASHAITIEDAQLINSKLFAFFKANVS